MPLILLTCVQYRAAEDGQYRIILLQHDAPIMQLPIPVEWKLAQPLSQAFILPAGPALPRLGDVSPVAHSDRALLICAAAGIILHVVLLCYPGKEAGQLCVDTGIGRLLLEERCGSSIRNIGSIIRIHIKLRTTFCEA